MSDGPENYSVGVLLIEWTLMWVVARVKRVIDEASRKYPICTK
jgi:hypothetical protein